MKLFQRAQRSLFGEILDWMLTPLLLLVPVSIGVTWLVAQGIANAPFDRALEYNVQTLARLVTVQHGQTHTGDLRGDLVRNPLHLLLRHGRVRLVFEERHVTPVVLVPHHAHEHVDAPGAGMRDGRHALIDTDGRVADREEGHAEKSPERPPVFLSSRVGPIVMPRSTDLSMS